MVLLRKLDRRKGGCSSYWEGAEVAARSSSNFTRPAGMSAPGNMRRGEPGEREEVEKMGSM